MILIAILAPPLYFLIKRRWIGLCLTLLAMAYSTLLLVTLVMSPMILVFWGLAATGAVLDLVFGSADREDERRHKLPEGKR